MEKMRKNNRVPFWNREEVLMTYDSAVYNRGKNVLSENQIPYTTKIRSEYEQRTRMMGNLGQSSAYNVMYKIYTRREWAERARYLLRSVRREQ